MKNGSSSEPAGLTPSRARSESTPSTSSEKPDLFARLRALNTRLADQESRLAPSPSEPPKPTLPSVVRNNSGAEIVLKKKRTEGSSLRAWLVATAPAPAQPPSAWQEKEHLYRDWSHNTAFFRDDAIWTDLVANAVLFSGARAALNRAPKHGSLRVWSCGCSSGEELFSTRMLYEKWVRPTFEKAFGKAPVFEGLGTDRSQSIVDTALDVAAEWTMHALANVPKEFFLPSGVSTRAHVGFVEQPESSSDLALRQAREYATGEKELPMKRFRLSEGSRSNCRFAVEDTTSAPAWPGEEDEEQPEEELWDVIMCRYSIFLYSESTAESTAEEKSKRALSRLVKRLHPEGVLLLGLTDPLPQCASAILEPLPIPELLDDSCKVTSRPSTPEDFVSMLKAQNSRKLSPAWNAWRLKKHARPQTSVATQEAIANAALAAEAAAAPVAPPPPPAPEPPPPTYTPPPGSIAASFTTQKTDSVLLERIRGGEILSIEEMRQLREAAKAEEVAASRARLSALLDVSDDETSTPRSSKDAENNKCVDVTDNSKAVEEGSPRSVTAKQPMIDVSDPSSSAIVAAIASSSKKPKTDAMSPHEAMKGAVSLQHMRRMLGLKLRFAERAPGGAASLLSAKTLAILQRSTRPDTPLQARAQEMTKQHKRRIEAMRRQKEESEVAEMEKGAEALRASLRASRLAAAKAGRATPHHQYTPPRPQTSAGLLRPSTTPSFQKPSPRPSTAAASIRTAATRARTTTPVLRNTRSDFIDRMQAEAELRASRLASLTAATQGMYDMQFGAGQIGNKRRRRTLRRNVRDVLS